MTPAQKLALSLSRVKERLNTIAGLDELDEETRTELSELETRYSDTEKQWRAAVLAEAEHEAAVVGINPDGTTDTDGAELRGILGRVSLSDYLSPASHGVGLTGIAAEVNQALDLPAQGPSGGVAVPWRVLLEDAGMETRSNEDSTETRADAFTTTSQYDGPTRQRPILQRLFGPDILSPLGVRIDSVPVGRSEWPLVATGVAPEQKTETEAAPDAVMMTFATETLKPKRLTGRYVFSHEMAASVQGLEAALRRDLAAAVRSKMNALALTGNETTNSHEPDGFLTKLSAPTAPSAVATYADLASSHAKAVDGIHAATEMQVSSVVGVDVYQHAAETFQAGSGESASEAMRRRSRSCIASSYIPSAPASGQTGAGIASSNLYHAAGPNGGPARGDSIAAMWPVLEIVRDIYSQASTGVVLTWVGLWDLEAAFRSAAYRRVAFKLF